MNCCTSPNFFFGDHSLLLVVIMGIFERILKSRGRFSDVESWSLHTSLYPVHCIRYITGSGHE